MKVNIVSPSLYITSFITFIGYYLIVMVVLYIFSEQVSRLFTIPTRIFASVLMILITVRRGIYYNRYSTPIILFAVFSMVYLVNVILEMYKGDPSFASRSAQEIFMYFIIYAILPFYFFSQKKKIADYDIIYKSILLSGVLLSLASLFIYKDILFAGYSRISSASNSVEYDIISPLSLSYSASLLIGVSLTGIIFKREINISINYLYFGIIVGLIPFVLGASRGSLVSLIVPFIFIFMYKNKGENRLKILITILVTLIIGYFVSEYLSSGIFNRFLAIGNDLQNNSSSVYRLILWNHAYQQFLSSPFLGDSIHFEINNYPHNLILESLMAVGFLGSVPLIALLIHVVKKSIYIIKYQTSLIWIVVVMWQGVISSLFSYAIYTNIFLYASLGLIVSVRFKQKSVRS